MRLTTTAGGWARPFTVISSMTASLMLSHVCKFLSASWRWNWPICKILSEWTGSTCENSAMHSFMSKCVLSLSWQLSQDINLRGITSRSLGSAASGKICKNCHKENHPSCMGRSSQCPYECSLFPKWSCNSDKSLGHQRPIIQLNTACMVTLNPRG